MEEHYEPGTHVVDMFKLEKHATAVRIAVQPLAPDFSLTILIGGNVVEYYDQNVLEALGHHVDNIPSLLICRGGDDIEYQCVVFQCHKCNVDVYGKPAWSSDTIFKQYLKLDKVTDDCVMLNGTPYSVTKRVFRIKGGMGGFVDGIK